MPFESYGGDTGSRVSPGGFEFGVQGWSWGESVPKSITFFLDNTAMVCDQYGRPIKGVMVNGKEVWFANCGPAPLDTDRSVPYPQRFHDEKKKIRLATHQEIINALTEERIDWSKLNCAGWPQLPYDELKKLTNLPPTLEEDLLRIPDLQMRKDALRARREADSIRTQEMVAADSE